jgi:DNA-binding GntR family transcriptional regulator
VVVEHRAIVEAIARRDPLAAEAAMRAHLESVLPVFDQVRAAYPAYFEPEPQSRPRRLAAG